MKKEENLFGMYNSSNISSGAVLQKYLLKITKEWNFEKL